MDSAGIKEPSPARSDSGSSSDSEQEHEYAMQIFRTDGHWYNDAFRVLPEVACLIRQTDVAHGLTSLPPEVCHHIGKFNWTNDDAFGIQRLVIARQASDYILSTLRERMASLIVSHPECVYLPNDPYMNVINYFRALKGDEFLKGLMKADDEYLLENVLPWLGLTDWGSNSGSKGGKHGGRTIQMHNFKSKLKQFLEQTPPSARANLKRKARESASSAEESVALTASTALPESVAATESVPVPASGPLSPHELRRVRAEHFGFKLSKADTGGKRLHTRKLRMLRKRKSKSSKRTCKRCRSARS